ncbi:hypothetical protein [Solirubrobacter soli]|uniref:hypothetical protein n=1 Tax=Solirubrobacter soli TaxID=363832 RepID=UPI0004168F64|nr:hypothetical protein [Solirubrobacter soli]
MPASSSSSTDFAAGYRLERELGRGTRGVVHEATQLGLDRRVALKRLPATPFRPAAWPRLPGVVTLYAVGESDGDLLIAMQLVDGRSLGAPHPPEVFDEIERTLAAVHAQGLVHGALTAGSVLVDARGHALLTDFGFGPPDATPEDDRAALAALRETYEARGGEAARGVGAAPGEAARGVDAAPGEAARGVDAAPGEAARGVDAAPGEAARGVDAAPGEAARGVDAAPGEARRGRGRGLSGRPWRAAAALAVLVAGGLAVVAARADHVPPVAEGATGLGSALDGGGVRSVDCAGRAPSGASRACSVMQDGVVVPARGALRGWAVRGASGDLALQVVRERGGRFIAVASTPYVHVDDTGPHALPADLPVQPGDRIAVELTPGAALGVRDTAGHTNRFSGPLRYGLRRAERGVDAELQVRADFVRGATSNRPATLTGTAARTAPTGRIVARSEVALRTGEVRTLAVTRLETGGVALDLLRGDTRLARAPLAGADPRGRLDAFTTSGQDTGEPTPEVRWRNPGGGTVAHTYRVGARDLLLLS